MIAATVMYSNGPYTIACHGSPSYRRGHSHEHDDEDQRTRLHNGLADAFRQSFRQALLVANRDRQNGLTLARGPWQLLRAVQREGRSRSS
jgi:hypothetical protein